MDYSKLYKISNKVIIDGSLSATELQSRLANSLKDEGVDDVVLKDSGVEFRNYFSWAVSGRFQIFTIYRNIMVFVSCGLIRIDERQRTIYYEISMFPFFVLCILSSLLFFLLAEDIVWSVFFVTFVWGIYGRIYLTRNLQFDSFIKKSATEMIN